MLTIKIKTDNAAFGDGYEGEECARILKTIGDRLIGGFIDGNALDANGNTVGSFKLTPSKTHREAKP